MVGAGNSGREIAVELSQAGADVCVVGQGGVAFIPRPESVLLAESVPRLLSTLPHRAAETLFKKTWGDFRAIGLPWPTKPPLENYPVVGFELPDAVRAGRVQVRGGIAHFSERRVTFKDGQAQDFDAVILATGYRPTLGFVQRDQLAFDSPSWPRLDPCWRSVANPHLICLGFAYPATEGWLQSIGRFAHDAAEGIHGRRQC